MIKLIPSCRLGILAGENLPNRWHLMSKSYLKNPDVVNVEGWSDRMTQLLDERNLGVLTSVTSLLVAIMSNNYDAYWSCVPKCVKILERLARNNDVPPEYTDYGISSLWLQVKTMRALQYFPNIEDPNTRKSLFEVLQRVLMGIDVVKNVNKNNASHAVLFEALALMDRYQRVEKPRAKTPINENEIRITTQGRMRNYITYATTLLQDKGSNEIVLKAMGRAINKNVMIAELIKRRMVSLHQNTSIGSTDITDIWEHFWKKAKRITSHSDESCSPQAPRQGKVQPIMSPGAKWQHLLSVCLADCPIPPPRHSTRH
ncbi:hypothetical protein IFM89_012416 [Coptis chinensis]|uniref:Uncharacterized protein n=1 Tax=Coptis chinensis TaxID=261450 RepID=A0A835LZB9_9MAGN|nr:hypothetical protein IFM89_012416 [Coptis chinensis]